MFLNKKKRLAKINNHIITASSILEMNIHIENLKILCEKNKIDYFKIMKIIRTISTKTKYGYIDLVKNIKNRIVLNKFNESQILEYLKDLEKN